MILSQVAGAFYGSASMCYGGLKACRNLPPPPRNESQAKEQAVIKQISALNLPNRLWCLLGPQRTKIVHIFVIG